MEQQTAVDWFYNAIEKNTLINLSTLYEQAKAMEKEQIMTAFQYGTINDRKKWADEYYNETYE